MLNNKIGIKTELSKEFVFDTQVLCHFSAVSLDHPPSSPLAPTPHNFLVSTFKKNSKVFSKLGVKKIVHTQLCWDGKLGSY